LSFKKISKIDIKINNIEKYLKLVVQNMSNNISQFEFEEKENIDICQDMPLKKKDYLESLKIKLSNNALYRNEMVSLISISIS